MAITFYATNNFTGDGTTVNWNINFADGYIDIANVKARYLNSTGSYVDIAISSVAGNVVTISPAVANGQEFQIYRDTEKRFPLVDFSDGAILNEANLDTLATQAVMVSAEAFDQSNNGVRIAGDALNTATGIADTANLALSNSETALTTANGIASTANTALANSNAAIATANDASSVANGIAATADAALQNSATALSTANDASDTANAIAGTANAALSTAQGAETTANSALSTADAIANTKANKGANSDITSLTGLTTALSITQGGTGATTAAGARSNLSLGSAALKNTGVSGDAIPLLNANNTWSGVQTLGTPLAVASGGTGVASLAELFTALNIFGRVVAVKRLVASDTWTPSATAKAAFVFLQAGGGAGGGASTPPASNASAGSGGNSGSAALIHLPTLATSYSCIVGSGGIGVSGQPGGNGGDTSLGAICSVVGGAGGNLITASDIRNTGPTTQSNDFTQPTLFRTGPGFGAAGSVFNSTITQAGHGADSFFGSGGRAFNANPGMNGGGFGSGGGGTACSTGVTQQPGGNGAGGCILIIELS